MNPFEKKDQKPKLAYNNCTTFERNSKCNISITFMFIIHSLYSPTLATEQKVPKERFGL